MSEQRLIIITGPAGAGKTTLGRRLATDLKLPFFSKDAFKDILFDNLGWQDRAWSQKLGGTSFELLFHVTHCQLQSGHSLIVETAFHPKFHTERFSQFQKQYSFQTYQIYCRTDTRTLFDRFHQRAVSGERHPGHVDHLGTYEEFRSAIEVGKYAPLEIEGTFIEIDTTNFNRIDYDGLLAQLQGD